MKIPPDNTYNYYFKKECMHVTHHVYYSVYKPTAKGHLNYNTSAITSIQISNNVLVKQL